MDNYMSQTLGITITAYQLLTALLSCNCCADTKNYIQYNWTNDTTNETKRGYEWKCILIANPPSPVGSPALFLKPNAPISATSEVVKDNADTPSILKLSTKKVEVGSGLVVGEEFNTLVQTASIYAGSTATITAPTTEINAETATYLNTRVILKDLPEDVLIDGSNSIILPPIGGNTQGNVYRVTVGASDIVDYIYDPAEWGYGGFLTLLVDNDITISHNQGNIMLSRGGNFVTPNGGSNSSTLVLFWDNANNFWTEISRSIK